LRGLDKTTHGLWPRPKDRWYVPDPNKAQDLEKKREKALLKEFEGLPSSDRPQAEGIPPRGAARWLQGGVGAKNYKAIIAIAQKIPEEALQEDEKLLLWYDQALTRTEAGA
jgi:hypothetical protein